MSKRDPRVWREGCRATVVDDVVAIQNLDRHVDTSERRAYQREYRAKYIAGAPARRAANPEVMCRKCWQLKATDGSDGAGGFTPDNMTRTGWMTMCRVCRRTRRKRAGREHGQEL